MRNPHEQRVNRFFNSLREDLSVNIGSGEPSYDFDFEKKDYTELKEQYKEINNMACFKAQGTAYALETAVTPAQCWGLHVRV